MAPKAPAPAEVKENPYLPAGMQIQVMEQFGGINTSTTRAGVPEQQCYWIDGFIPLDQRNLRTLYSNGSAIYTPGGGKTIVCFDFANIADVPIAVVFLDDGSVVQINLNDNSVTTILAASTIASPSITNVGVTQWGQQYVIIVAGQTDGYWLWDGVLLFKAGTLSPTITLTNPGNSYQSVPTVIVSGGTGSGAQVVATIAGGFVTDAIVTNPGSGYSAGDIVTLTFTGGTAGGSGGVLAAVVTSSPGGSGASLQANFTAAGGGVFQLTSVTVLSGGTGYSAFTTYSIDETNLYIGSPGPTTLALTIAAGVITGVTVTNMGLYVAASAPITVSDAGTFVVSSITITNGGSGYSPSIALSVSGGDTPVVQATLRAVLTAGVITSVVILGGGSYASASPLPSISISDAPDDAEATALLMPFGIQGTTIETYSQRVWVGNGPHFYFTAPGSFVDFATTSGGGNQTSGDSFLRVNYTRFLNTNGFLFMVADSSVSYISGVQTNSVGDPPVPVTTFTYQNADPEVGSPYPCSVKAFGRDVMLANAVGVFAGYGGAYTKVSDELDGVYNTVADFGSVQISSAKAIIFARKIFMELVRIIDPVSGSTVNKLLMWNGKKWFSSNQGVTLTFINSNEINSVLTAYGTDGSSLYALFQTASASLQKVVQSKYWDTPGYMLDKSNSRFWGLAKYYDVNTPNIVLNVDAVVADVSGATVENVATYTITGPSGAGYFVMPPLAVGQRGVLTGMTIKTSSKDMSLISVALDNNNVDYRG